MQRLSPSALKAVTARSTPLGHTRPLRRLVPQRAPRKFKVGKIQLAKHDIYYFSVFHHVLFAYLPSSY